MRMKQRAQHTQRADDPVDEAPEDEDAAMVEAEARLNAELTARQQERDARVRAMRRQARSVFRTMQGWGSVQDEASWLQTVSDAKQGYESGQFVVEQLGARRHLDPQLTAVLWSLRQQLIEDLGVATASERMLVDMAVISYAHMLQFQRWTGNLALSVEHDLFGQASPSAAFKSEYGRGMVRGLKVEELLQRIGEQLLPLMDRSERMFIRALRELRRPQPPSVAIAQAGQVNVGAVQQNSAHVAESEAAPRAPRRRGRTRGTAVLASPDTDAAPQGAARRGSKWGRC